MQRYLAVFEAQGITTAVDVGCGPRIPLTLRTRHVAGNVSQPIHRNGVEQVAPGVQEGPDMRLLFMTVEGVLIPIHLQEHPDAGF